MGRPAQPVGRAGAAALLLRREVRLHLGQARPHGRDLPQQRLIAPRLRRRRVGGAFLRPRVAPVQVARKYLGRCGERGRQAGCQDVAGVAAACARVRRGWPRAAGARLHNQASALTWKGRSAVTASCSVLNGALAWRRMRFRRSTNSRFFSATCTASSASVRRRNPGAGAGGSPPP